MKQLRGFQDSAACRGGFVSIGNFDGVHLGHQTMIRKLVQHARAAKAPAVVFTFDPHPAAILRPGSAPPSLSTAARKAELLDSLGVDFLIAYPTDRPLLSLSAEQFFEEIVVRQLGARGLVEGPNFFLEADAPAMSERSGHCAAEQA
jgi:riboflavin kinase/FMN adenylyltransferase